MNSIPATSAAPPVGLTVSRPEPAQKPQGLDLPDNLKAEFSALVLKSFLEQAVPSELLGADGPGAGMWRSMLVDQLAKSIADSGQIDVL